MGDKLTRKQLAFVQEYLTDLNGTQAAIRAGYSPRTANVTAAQALAKPNIQQAVEKAFAKRSERTEVTADRVVVELGRIAFAHLGDVATWDSGGLTLVASEELSDDAIRSVAEVTSIATKETTTLRIKLVDKLGALNTLAKHLGMFPKEGIHVDNRTQAVVVMEDGSDPREALDRIVAGIFNRRGTDDSDTSDESRGSQGPTL